MTTLEVIATAIGTAATVIGGVWFILSKVFKLGQNEQHLKEFEKNTTENFKRMSEDIAALRKTVGALPCASHHDDLLKIKTVLVQKYPTSASVFSAKASPRKLNEPGRKLFEDIEGEDFLLANKEALFQFITDSKPLVALDVEQAALSACSSLVDTPAFNKIKDYVYNAPSIDLPDGRKYDITVADTCFVLSLRLRDMYLQENE